MQPSAEPWAAPGSLAEPEPGASSPASGTTATSTTVTAATEVPPDEVEVSPVPQLRLQPMTVADILDGAFSLIKSRPARLLGISALFVVPVHLLAAYLQRNALGDAGILDAMTSEDPALRAEAQSTSDSEWMATLLVWIIPALALVCVAAGIARMVSGWTVGHDSDAGELLRAVGRSAWALLASFVLVHLAEVVGLFVGGIGILFVMPFFVVTAPVIGAEGLGPIAAIRRSARLGTRRYWPVMGISVLTGIVATLVSNALGGLPQALALYVGLDVAWPLLAAGNIVSAVITTPFVAAATVLLYLDLRIRNEGLDIELTARELVDDGD